MSDPLADVDSADVSVKKKHHRRHRRHHKRRPRDLLRTRRRQVSRQTRKITDKLEDTDLSTQAGERELRRTIGSLRSTLRKLRKEVQHRGRGRKSKPVAGALKDLDEALARLAKAGSADDPNAKMLQLYHGMRALDQAQKKAKAAGHDWTI